MGSIVCGTNNYEHPNDWNEQEWADWNYEHPNDWNEQEWADWNYEHPNDWNEQEWADWNYEHPNGDEEDDEDEGDDDVDEYDDEYDEDDDDDEEDEDEDEDVDEYDDEYDEDDDDDEYEEYKREKARLVGVLQDLTTLVAVTQLAEDKELDQLKKLYHKINFMKVILELCQSDQERSEKQDQLDGFCEYVRVFEMGMLQNTLLRCDHVSNMQIAKFKCEVW
jgi:hypothetical protein